VVVRCFALLVSARSNPSFTKRAIKCLTTIANTGSIA